MPKLIDMQEILDVSLFHLYLTGSIHLPGVPIREVDSGRPLVWTDLSEIELDSLTRLGEILGSKVNDLNNKHMVFTIQAKDEADPDDPDDHDVDGQVFDP